MRERVRRRRPRNQRLVRLVAYLELTTKKERDQYPGTEATRRMKTCLFDGRDVKQ